MLCSCTALHDLLAKAGAGLAGNVQRWEREALGWLLQIASTSRVCAMAAWAVPSSWCTRGQCRGTSAQLCTAVTSIVHHLCNGALACWCIPWQPATLMHLPTLQRLLAARTAWARAGPQATPAGGCARVSGCSRSALAARSALWGSPARQLSCVGGPGTRPALHPPQPASRPCGTARPVAAAGTPSLARTACRCGKSRSRRPR